MSRRTLIWGIPALLYAVFFVWYTDLGGPLEPEEIDRFVTVLGERGFTPEQQVRLREFMEADTGREFLMVNVIDMAEDPPDVEGAEPGLTAQQLMDHYMEHMYVQLFQRASHPVVFGDAVFRVMDVVGIDGAEQWTMAGLMRYRSRRSFVEIVTHPAMRGRHEFKTAALDKTIAYPIETQIYLGDPRVLLGLGLLAAAALTDLATARRG